MQFVDADLATQTVQRRAQLSENTYVTYCAMCRDRFAKCGKSALHLLDLIFPEQSVADAAARPDPGFSLRRENRARLKRRLLQKLWHEEIEPVQVPFTMLLDEDLSQKLEDRMILVEDLRNTIAYAEQSGEKLVDQSNGHYIACSRPACVQYWVDYSQQGDSFVVHNAYSHRMQVK